MTNTVPSNRIRKMGQSFWQLLLAASKIYFIVVDRWNVYYRNAMQIPSAQQQEQAEHEEQQYVK